MNSAFLEQMKELLKDEYPSYIAAVSEPAKQGLRVNTLKADVSEITDLLKERLVPSAFSANGFYFDKPTGFGLSPVARSGIVYMQEPSASGAVTVLRPEKGMRVLDLCAAPGSKATQIAEYLGNDGLLVANEYVSKRSLILRENIISNGTSCALLLNSDTADIAKHFHDYFDMVLCDAPCSGEGMFRKNENAESEWSEENVIHCAQRQKEILHNAYLCLKKDGVLVYSTCTFNLCENEDTVKQFLTSHPDMVLEDPDVSFGRRSSILPDTVRIFPMDGGEGHFIARMRKTSGTVSDVPVLKSEKIPSALLSQLHEIITVPYPYYYLKEGRLYGGSAPFVSAGKCRIVSHQVYLGDWLKNRFVPSHHLFMSSWGGFAHTAELDDHEADAYLRGDQIFRKGEKGYYAVCWHHHALGGAKSDGNVLKNHYPKNLRLRPR